MKSAKAGPVYTCNADLVEDDSSPAGPEECPLMILIFPRCREQPLLQNSSGILWTPRIFLEESAEAGHLRRRANGLLTRNRGKATSIQGTREKCQSPPELPSKHLALVQEISSPAGPEELSPKNPKFSRKGFLTGPTN